LRANYLDLALSFRSVLHVASTAPVAPFSIVISAHFGGDHANWSLFGACRLAAQGRAAAGYIRNPASDPQPEALGDLAILKDVTLSPDLSIGAIMERFDESGADDLAVVDFDGQILGMLTEKYVRNRYADEIDRSQRDLYGED